MADARQRLDDCSCLPYPTRQIEFSMTSRCYEDIRHFASGFQGIRDLKSHKRRKMRKQFGTIPRVTMSRVFYLNQCVIRACASVIFTRALPRPRNAPFCLVEAIGHPAVRAGRRHAGRSVSSATVPGLCCSSHCGAGLRSDCACRRTVPHPRRG